MVSFFGLKLGADKKKKAEKAPEPKPQPKKRIDQNALGQGQFFGSNLERPLVINGSRPGTAMSNKSFVTNFAHPNAPSLTGGGPPSIYGSRPGTSMSNKKFVPNFFHPSDPNAPYFGGWSSSMTNLAAPAPDRSIRPMGSESNLKTVLNNGSVTKSHTMPTLPVITTDDRPATSTALSVRRRVPAASNAPRSPLGQFEFNLGPSEVSRQNLVPAPLSPSKAYPSPPQSINGSLPSLKTDIRPKTAVSTVRDAHRPGPASLPSPTASTERSSEEALTYPRPIIQNVAAKRDTFTYHPPRRQSFSMDIDEGPTSLNFNTAPRPSTSAGPSSPPPRSALRPSPPELKNLPSPPAVLAPAHSPVPTQTPRSPALPPPRPRQVPYEGPLRSPARPPDDCVNAKERMNTDAREKPTFESRTRMNSDAHDRPSTDPQTPTSPGFVLPSYLGPPPSSRRTAPGEGERNYGVTPANRRPPPPLVELQRKASVPQVDPVDGEQQQNGGSFAMISPRMLPPQPPSPGNLIPEPSSDANWPLPSPLASPTFGTGRRPYTPSEISEGQMSPGLTMPLTPSYEQRDAHRRPDFGLRAPTGIADEFRIGFI
ncbi:hypothetical protein Cob_v005896 [Colletotrichum orbiculare MAFF 240422]|uniref:Uncharacterized protein n=1 Tax=Colletotrichum orbiculare (strain 104-T / ATCC 96160 / CBS 514.97 / LARS 414 / MAFF 240422) TaxID=1213857 RepID=A0A484FUS4_COLOR|nr:hypothetical protein Cob_v005896 [Colletotrichum orbiculare MAFF 240422]